MRSPAAFAPSPSAARAELHLRHIRKALGALHAAVAGQPEAERAADALHAHLAAGLEALARSPQIALAVQPDTGGVDPGPKPSSRESAAASWAAV